MQMQGLHANHFVVLAVLLALLPAETLAVVLELVAVGHKRGPLRSAAPPLRNAVVVVVVVVVCVRVCLRVSLSLSVCVSVCIRVGLSRPLSTSLDPSPSLSLSTSL